MYENGKQYLPKDYHLETIKTTSTNVNVETVDDFN